MVVGSASRDVVADDPRGWRLGGGAAYGALTLARLGLRVGAVIGVDGRAADASELGWLRVAGVELRPVPLAHGPVFVNRERPAGREQLALDASDPIPSTAMPPAWSSAAAVLLTPIADELGAAWAEAGPTAAVVGLGWQGLLREVLPDEVVARRPPLANSLLGRADLVGVSVDDVGREVRLSALVDLVKPGATLVVTRGERGGTVLTSRRPGRSALRAYPAIAPNTVIDPTGAGDVFLATLLATLIASDRVGGGDWTERLTLAAAAASLCVERPGLAGVPTLAAVRRRAAEVA